MKKFYFLLLSILLFLSPDASRARQKVTLNGNWHSTMGECRLPGTIDTKFYPYEGRVLYHRSVRLPRSFNDKRLRLVMERTKNSTLWVHGDSIGSRTSLSAPHIYDLPAFTDRNAEISIMIDNLPAKMSSSKDLSIMRKSGSFNDGRQTNWNGILGDIYIEACDSTFIASLEVHPDVDRKSVEVRMTIEAEKAASAKLSIDIDRYDSMDDLPSSSVKYLLNLKEGLNTFSYNVSMGDSVRLWSEFHPSLYKVTASVKSLSSEDKVSEVFGMRDFSNDGNRFTINGKRTFLRGISGDSISSFSGYPSMKVSQWRQLFIKAKEKGINYWHFTSYFPPHAAFTAADLEGVYIYAGQQDNLKEFGNHPSFVMRESAAYPDIVRINVNDSARFAVKAYKNGIEAALKADRLGGFLLPDIQENHADSLKNICSAFVPLASFGEERLNASDTLNVPLSVANFTEQDWSGMVEWTLTVQELLPLTDQTLPDFHGKTSCTAIQGQVSPAGRIFLPLSFLGLREGESCRVSLRLSAAEGSNSYDFWIFYR